MSTSSSFPVSFSNSICSNNGEIRNKIKHNNKRIAPNFRTISLPFQAFGLCRSLPRHSSKKSRSAPAFSLAAMASAGEVLPPALGSASEPPPLFDGTTRLYTSYICPYAQRPWIARNYKGLQEKIKLVPIDLRDKPAWYKEKVYPSDKVPSLEHNNEVRGESLDLIKYIDSHFEGPALCPDDPTKRDFAEELLSYTDTFTQAAIKSVKGDSETEISTALDSLETTLSKFKDGPFFLGQFSLEMNKIEAYTQTKRDPEELVAVMKRLLSLN